MWGKCIFISLVIRQDFLFGNVAVPSAILGNCSNLIELLLKYSRLTRHIGYWRDFIEISCFYIWFWCYCKLNVTNQIFC